MVVCHCEALSDRRIRDAISRGVSTVDELTAMCGAGGRCGGCVESLEHMLANHAAPAQAAPAVGVSVRRREWRLGGRRHAMI